MLELQKHGLKEKPKNPAALFVAYSCTPVAIRINMKNEDEDISKIRGVLSYVHFMNYSAFMLK